MKLVIKQDRSIEYAEERRLFYVAMTRTKNRIFIAVPKERPSIFISEFVNDYSNVKVNGELEMKKTDSAELSLIKRCPVCGYPMQFRHKRGLGLKLWICTNEPEICDFMTNDLAGKDLSILKCDCCKDGYLIVRRGPEDAFLGCTNYKDDKSGCNRTLNRYQYKDLISRESIDL
jgi:DNA helicase-4